MVIGGVLVYLFDPERGRRRRALLRDRLRGMLHRSWKRARKGSRKMRSRGYGMRQRAVHRLLPHEVAPQDDVTLAHRVESFVFRDQAVPKGAINISAEKGVVVLRGQLDSPEQVRTVEHDALRVPGVHKVESYLHLTGTPAPNKAAARMTPVAWNGTGESRV
jgi:hypothetical protein